MTSALPDWNGLWTTIFAVSPGTYRFLSVASSKTPSRDLGQAIGPAPPT